MKVTMQVWLEVFMMFLMISDTCPEPLTQGVAFNDNALLGDGFDQNIIEITELPETGGPQVSVDKTSDQIQDNHHKHVHTLPHISMNGIPLDDDPLTLDVWEDKEEYRAVKRAKRFANNSEVFREHVGNVIKHCDKTAAVDANGTKIVLCLNKKKFSEEDTLIRNYENLTITVYGPNTTRTKIQLSSLQLEFGVGWVIGEVFSSVSGYILDNIFYGSIFINNEIYYVDPLKNTASASDKFKNDSMSHVPTVLRDSPLAPSKVEPVKPDGTKRRKRGADGKERRICSLALVSDHIFHQMVGGGDVRATVLLMLYHVKEANAVFITKDFDSTGGSDCLGFQVEAITILETEHSYVNILLGDYNIPEDFLRKFSRYNFAEYCLGLLFTNRLFKDLVLGLSWRGNPKQGGVGGTCQERARYKEDGKTYSFNSLFISMRSQQQDRIPLRMAILNLVHELMHAFGAKHDPDAKERADCTPSDMEANGRFLMSKYSNNGRRHNHEVLSPCTKESVIACLSSPQRTSCVKSTSAGYCGNGVVEEGEECDCGDEFQCLVTRSCCFPPTGGEDNRPCSTRDFCLNTENDVDDLIVPESVKEEPEKEDQIKPERVEGDKEEKKYLKTTRVCQFFNIC